MKILIAWDDPGEAELLCLYLGTGENEACLGETKEDVLKLAAQGGWDAVLTSLAYPTPDEGLHLFSAIQQVIPNTPVVVACRPSEMIYMPRFLRRGLRFYSVRDASGDFVFLALASIESAVQSLRAEEARKLANHLREEMDGIRRLQESIIPHGLKPPDGYKVVARYESAQLQVMGERPVVMAGGDYYDLFRPDDTTLVILLGDASGHGLKACMSIMTMHTLVRMIPGHQYRKTADFVAEVNQRLCENSIVQSGGGFITLLYAAIDTTNHTMSWTSAGHPFALLQMLDTNEVIQVGTPDDGGMPLAIAPGMDYLSRSVQLPPRCRLLLYTDGLTDAFPADAGEHTQFGVPGIMQALKDSCTYTLDDALEHLFSASNAFTGGSGRHDDTSAVLLERVD